MKFRKIFLTNIFGKRLFGKKRLLNWGAFDSHKNVKKAEVVLFHKLGVGHSPNFILKLSILIQ